MLCSPPPTSVSTAGPRWESRVGECEWCSLQGINCLSNHRSVKQPTRARAKQTLLNHLWQGTEDGWQLNNYSPDKYIFQLRRAVTWNERFLSCSYFFVVELRRGRVGFHAINKKKIIKKKLYNFFLPGGVKCSWINKLMPASHTTGCRITSRHAPTTAMLSKIRNASSKDTGAINVMQ